MTYLNKLAVELGPNLERLGILNEVRAHDTRAIRRPPVEPLSKRPLSSAALDLPVPV